MARQDVDSNNAAAVDDFFETADVQTLANQQGVSPLNFARARELGKFWPKDESIDDFIASVRRWRDEGGDRELP